MLLPDLIAGSAPLRGAHFMLFRTAGILPAHAHDAGWKPAVRKMKTMSATEWRAPSNEQAWRSPQ